MVSTETVIDIDKFKPVIIIGGGTCGLAAASRLCERSPGSIYTEDEHQRFHWLRQRGNNVNLINKRNMKKCTKGGNQPNFNAEDILVFDEIKDTFMGQWDNQFESCQIPFLRSPMFFHPDPVNIDGMVSYAHLNKREKELKEIENIVGKEYSKHQYKKRTKKIMKAAVSPMPTNGLTQDQPGIVDINMRDWRDFYRPSTKFFRDFCQDIIDRYNLHNVVQKQSVLDIDYTDITVSNETGKGFVVKTANGTYGCKICILATGHRGKPNFPISPFPAEINLDRSCHTTHLFTRQVPFPHQSLTKRSTLVIVGGGLTSAQLAHVAICKGIENVYLLLRGPMKIKHFDFHLDWVTKYKNLKKSSFYISDTDEERLRIINEAREGGSVNPEYHRIISKHAKAGRLQLLKNTKITGQEWDDFTNKWQLELSDGQCVAADYVVCATGITPDITNLPFMKTMNEKFPIDSVKGFPCVTDDLEWKPDLPFFVTGKNASLRLGPSSANLDGARLGAERIGWFVQEKNSKGAYEWSQNMDVENLKTQNSKKWSQNESQSFDLQMKMARGEINRYSLLEVA